MKGYEWSRMSSINLLYHELQLHLTKDLQVSGSFLTVFNSCFHLRIITEGFYKTAKEKALALSMNQNTLRDGQETFTDTVTSLHTKIHAKLTDVLWSSSNSILVINKKINIVTPSWLRWSWRWNTNLKYVSNQRSCFGWWDMPSWCGEKESKRWIYPYMQCAIRIQKNRSEFWLFKNKSAEARERN